MFFATAGELEALDPHLASHLDSADEDQIPPFFHSRQTTTKHTQNKNSISAGSFLTKISNFLSTTMAKKPALRKGRARLRRLLTQCIILLA